VRGDTRGTDVDPLPFPPPFHSCCRPYLQQIHLDPRYSKFGGDTSHGSHRAGSFHGGMRPELAGVTSSLKPRFMHAVFGDRGLASCIDVAQFDCTVDRLRDGLLTEVPDHVRSYFNNRCVWTCMQSCHSYVTIRMPIGYFGCT